MLSKVMGCGAEMNEIVKYLADEHKKYLQELSDIEVVLSGKNPPGDTWGVLETFLEVVEKLTDHFLDEEDFIFSELDMLPRKEPLVLVHLEHDDWDRVSSIARRDVASVVKYRDEWQKSSAVQDARFVINFIKRHFVVEEEIIFPMISNLTKEQQEKILQRLKGSDTVDSSKVSS